MAENEVVLEMRRMIADARQSYTDRYEAALVDIREKAQAFEAAIGQVSPEEALIALAGYARERLQE